MPVAHGGLGHLRDQCLGAGLIRYAHGHIEVMDRPGLEKRVCE